MLHAPISATEYVSRQRKTRPATAPPMRGSFGATSTSVSGGSDAIAPAWRRSHFIASTGGAAGEPTKATTWAEVKMRQKQHGHGSGVLGDTTGATNEGYGASSLRGASRPATARARFSRKDDAAPGGHTTAKENRGGGRIRPGSARPAASPGGGVARPGSARPAAASSTRIRAGTGRGGGQMPVDEELVAELTAARRAKAKVKPPAPAAAKKTAGVLNAIAASLGGGGGGGGGGGVTGGVTAAGKIEREPEGYKDGFRVQEMIPLPGHLECMREMARELDPRQQLWVARSMDKARGDIREAMA